MEASGSVKRYPLQRYTVKDLVRIYDTTRYDMERKLATIENEIGARNGNYYEIEQVELIFKLIRLPGGVEIIY